MPRPAILLALVTLTGCATGFRTVIVPATADQGVATKDIDACLAAQALSGFGHELLSGFIPGALGQSHTQRAGFVRCMADRGYVSRVLHDAAGVRWVLRDGAPPPPAVAERPCTPTC